VLQNLAPAFVIIWALAQTRQAPSVSVVAGLIVAPVSVAFVVELPTAPLGDIDLQGVALGLLSGVRIAIFSVLGGQAACACGSLTANTWAFVVAAGVWLVFQAFRGVPALLEHPSLLAGACVIGVFSTLTPFLLYAWGTARIGAEAGAVSVSRGPWSWAGATSSSWWCRAGHVRHPRGDRRVPGQVTSAVHRLPGDDVVEASGGHSGAAHGLEQDVEGEFLGRCVGGSGVRTTSLCRREGFPAAPRAWGAGDTGNSSKVF
jgi:hypothetical protein